MPGSGDRAPVTVLSLLLPPGAHLLLHPWPNHSTVPISTLTEKDTQPSKPSHSPEKSRRRSRKAAGALEDADTVNCLTLLCILQNSLGQAPAAPPTVSPNSGTDPAHPGSLATCHSSGTGRKPEPPTCRKRTENHLPW